MQNQITLCLGDNSSADAWAHKLTKKYAEENQIVFRGAITDVDQNLQHGCYYTGPVNLQTADILEVSKRFDSIVVLDQSQDQYSHSDIFVSMFRLIGFLKEKGTKVKLLNQKVFATMEYWQNLIEKNKSFCIMPWIYHGGYGGTHSTCFNTSANRTPLTKMNEITDWQKDENFNKIRKKMLAGVKIDRNCNACYKNEFINELSVRQNDTIKWVTELGLKSTKDLEKIKQPLYYEIRPSNKCNIMCRTCEPNYSHLIEKEAEKITDNYLKTIYPAKTWDEMSDFPSNIDHIRRLYVAGGEPTVSPELYNFLRKCITENKTNFNFRINTNAVKINDTLVNLFKSFRNLGFSCSIDGIPRVNDYIRWGTDTNTAIKNIHKLNENHQIAFISVVSIYNIASIGELLNFFDLEFPNAVLQLQKAGHPQDILSPFNHVDTDKVLRSLELAKTTKCYWHSERGTKSMIDALYQHYASSHKIDNDKLTKFFYYNDALDRFRKSKLSDYIPDLEACRSYTLQELNNK